MKYLRVNSFTLLELIVVMVLSSLVLMITLLAFQILHKQFTNYEANSEKIDRLYLFFNVFDHDLENALVYRDAEIFTLRKGIREITYTFEESLIKREESGQTDTLIWGIRGIKCKEESIIQNEVKMTLLFCFEKDTLYYNISYYTDKLMVSN